MRLKKTGHPYLPKAMRIAPQLPSAKEDLLPHPREALLVCPFYAKDPYSSFGKHVLTPSLALTSIAGATPSGWKVRFWDENLLQGPPPDDPFPAVVGISAHLTSAKRSYELADWFRARGSKVVLGGLHVTSCPDEAASHCDALAIGEGVQLWPIILRDLEVGNLKKRYVGGYHKPYCDDPPPKRDVLPRDAFLTTSSLIATRGCHNRCGFCYLSTRGLHVPYHVRDVESLVEEFRANDEPYGVFTDNNLGSRPDYLRALCRGLRPLEKIWSAAVTIDVTDDPSLVREMALAGCTGVFVGFESLTVDNLENARKKSPHPDDYSRRVRIFQENGIQVNASFVFGFDHDRPDIFERTTQWVEENRLECATFHILTPYPGTPLFRQLESEGRLLHKNWDLYDTGHVVFRPRHMSPEELLEGYATCYKRLFSHRSIWKRKPDTVSEWPGYFGMCYLYKRANWIWPLLIRHNLTHSVWNPVVEAARRRHLRFRTRMQRDKPLSASILPVTPGV